MWHISIRKIVHVANNFRPMMSYRLIWHSQTEADFVVLKLFRSWIDVIAQSSQSNCKKKRFLNIIFILKIELHQCVHWLNLPVQQMFDSWIKNRSLQQIFLIWNDVFIHRLYQILTCRRYWYICHGCTRF